MLRACGLRRARESLKNSRIAYMDDTFKVSPRNAFDFDQHAWLTNVHDETKRRHIHGKTNVKLDVGGRANLRVLADVFFGSLMFDPCYILVDP